MNLKKHRLLNKLGLGIVPLVAAAVVSAILFGLAGLASMFIMILLFFLPVFLIINNLDLGTDEKIFFSIFIGLAMFSLVTWYINRVIYSLRISAIVAFLLLVLLGFAIRFHKKTKGKPEKD